MGWLPGDRFSAGRAGGRRNTARPASLFNGEPGSSGGVTMRATFKIEGLRELDAALGELSKATARNVMKRAATKALEPIAEAARAKVQERTGNLRDSIVVSSRLSRRQAANLRYAAAMFAKQGRASALEAMRNELRASGRSMVQVSVGAGQLPHAHLIEFGTQHSPPRPYLRPAWDAGRERVLTDLKASLAAEIEKAAARARRKALKLKKS